ncbi:TPA: XRE family transcriptional regulator [Candidatus Gastranaerophilales bacterium HUM_20]|nr:transcriptional regulator XRE family [Clostridium sp. CAG:729]DAB24147.1 MAG TPA: XRE family transcriptional regulator [Candidatus Gastranaerophilales bacterium HUM_20]
MTDETNKIHIKIGLKIKLERAKRKLSQEKLAELADLSKTHVGDIERGTTIPTIETLNRIANALDITLVELVDVSKVDL